MGLINFITDKGTILGESFLAALSGRLDEGIMKKMSEDRENRKTRIRIMTKLKEGLEDRGYDLSTLRMKFLRGFDKPVFMKADKFFDEMESYAVIYDLVAIYDKHGDEIFIGDIIEEIMYEEIFGNNNDNDRR